MRAGTASALTAIDQGCAMVRRCAGWAGILVLAAMPARLLLVLLLWEAWKLGDGAGSRGTALSTIAWLAVAAWLVALTGRLVFIRACRAASESGEVSVRVALGIPWAWLWALLRPAIAIEALFWLCLPAMFLAPFFVALAGMAAVQAPDAGAGTLAPLRGLMLRTSWAPLIRLTLCFVLALAAAVFAVVHGAGIAAWAAEALPWVEPGRWSAMTGMDEPLFVMLAFAGGCLLTEPFWIAALVSLDRQARSRGTGDDLRDWFASLKTARQGGA